MQGRPEIGAGQSRFELTPDEQILASHDFRGHLSSLNAALVDRLEQHGEAPVINGNVLYAHKQEDFSDGAFNPGLAAKRQALVAMARRSRCFVEVGVAGGHGLLLALHANPDLRCLGIDLAERLKPNWPPVDIFVPATIDWFAETFPDRVRILKEASLAGLAQIAAEQPFGKVDAVHLDAGKRERMAELGALWPGLADRALLLQGDAKHGAVRESTSRMIARGLARLPDDEALCFEERGFQLVETGPAVLSGSVTLKDLEGRRVLLCTAHQDDEVLFGGHLLGALVGTATLGLACFFRPAPGRADTATRADALAALSTDLGIALMSHDLGVEPGEARLRRHIALENEPPHIRDRGRRPVHRHPLWRRLRDAARATIASFRPDVIITHNAVGEYGHREHIILHHAVRDAARRDGVDCVLGFGHRNTLAGFEVAGEGAAKQALLDYYKPQWDGAAIYDFALGPERFAREPLF